MSLTIKIKLKIKKKKKKKKERNKEKKKKKKKKKNFLGVAALRCQYLSFESKTLTISLFLNEMTTMGTKKKKKIAK
jgi:hypothetical protein